MIARTNSLILLRFGGMNPVTRAMAWMACSGIVFAVLNTILRVVTLQMNPLEVQFLRYFAGLIVMIPFIWRVGLRAYSPHGLVGQLRWWVSTRLAESDAARAKPAIDALLRTDLALKSSGDERLLLERLVVDLTGRPLRR